MADCKYHSDGCGLSLLHVRQDAFHYVAPADAPVKICAPNYEGIHDAKHAGKRCLHQQSSRPA